MERFKEWAKDKVDPRVVDYVTQPITPMTIDLNTKTLPTRESIDKVDQILKGMI